MKHVVLSGYYGYGNLGDEAILAAVLSQLRLRDIGVTVLTSDPAGTAETYGVPTAHRTDAFAVGRALMKADLFLQGGGSLIQDSTSWRSPLFYLAQLMHSSVVGTPFMILGQGIGPINRGWLHFLVRETLVHSKAVTLRDIASYAWALGNLPADLPIALTADPVYLMRPVGEAHLERLIEASHLDDQPRPWTMVSIKGDPRDKREMHAWIEALNGYSRDFGGTLLLCPFSGDMDGAFYAALQPALEGPNYRLPTTLTPAEVLGLIGQCVLMVAGRLHPLIMAANQRVPFVAITYDPKMTAAAAEFEQEPAAQRPLVGFRTLLEKMGDAAEDTDWPRRYDQFLPGIEQRALKNFEVMDQVLAGQVRGSDVILD